MQTPSTIAKKTKAEILEEYTKIKKQLDTAQVTAKEIHAQPNLELLQKTKNFTQTDQLETSFLDIRKSLGQILSNLQNKVTEQAEKYNEIQHAVELSQKQLQHQYHIEVTAEVLKNLVSEYDQKSKSLEESYTEKKRELDNAVTGRKRDWEREQEEYEYEVKLKSKREKERFEEEKTEQEKILSEKMKKIQEHEAEYTELKKKSEEFPALLDVEKQETEKRVREELKKVYDMKISALTKDSESERKFLELRIENLENVITDLRTQLETIKLEKEGANQKAQSLAEKIVDSMKAATSEKYAATKERQNQEKNA